MLTVGFPLEVKENETRRALLPPHLAHTRGNDHLYFAEGYARHLGYPDSDYEELGANIAPESQVYDCDVICKAKDPQPEEWDLYRHGHILWCWIHAVQGFRLTREMVARKMTGIAWENMYEGKRHSFWRNNELAGEAAIYHWLPIAGLYPRDLNVALIGRGNVAIGALRVFEKLGATVEVFNRHTAKGYLHPRLGEYDVVVNAVMWDIMRTDHFVYAGDLKRMKPGSWFVDVSCDEAGAIETSRPTKIEDPVYHVDGIGHYVVDHTPTIFPHEASLSISQQIGRYVDHLVFDTWRDIQVLTDALAFDAGEIIDPMITRYQSWKGAM
jgi:N5-(carboxyethyl)ornithine synthase